MALKMGVRNMSSLRKLQQDFSDYVFDNAANGLDLKIRDDGLSGKRRLQIYHNNIYVSLTEALKSVYPVVERLTGNEFFIFMAHNYITSHPSVSGNLHDFGSHFPDFISSVDAANELVYLPDVARLEWAYHWVFHAASSPSLDIARLGEVSEDQYDHLVFKLNQASKLIRSEYPVFSIWKANQQQQGMEESVDLNEGASMVLIIRRDQQVEFESLTAGEYAFLKSLSLGETFSLACEAALLAEPECVVDELFQTHVMATTLVDFSV